MTGSFTCYCGNTGGGTDTKKKKSAQKVDPGEENFPSTPAGFRTHDLLIMRLMLQPLSYPCSPILSCDFLSSQLGCVPGLSCSLKGDKRLTIEHILLTCSDFIEVREPLYS